jgi:tetratricopeptide (TPR) repeat protein
MQFDREDFRSSYAWAWYALGDAEYKIRNLTRAAEYYTHGINAAPGVADGYILLGNVRYKQDRPDEALRLLDRATEVNPPYGVPRMLRWRVLREQGRGAEARDDFQQALTLLGRRWIELVSLQLSDMLIGHGQVDDAIQVLWEVQERVPDSGKLHLYLGRAYLAKAQGDTEGRLTYLNLAQSELDEAERLLPEGPELSSARMNLAQAQRTAP